MNWLLKSSICLLSVHVFVASCSLVDRDRQEQLPLQEEASGPRRQLKVNSYGASERRTSSSTTATTITTTTTTTTTKNGHADRNEHEKDATIKKAVMKEILKLLGMKHRPPPIPLAKRKPNIPRPVYDGGIGGMSPDEDVKLQETQVVIAAEVDEDEGTNDNEEVPRFKFKLNHALFNDYVINYATLHVYNEADVGSEYGVFKTIYLKETLPARSGRPQGTNSKTFNLDKITKDKHQQAAKKSQETTHQAQGVDFKGSVHQKEAKDAKTGNDKGFFAHAAPNSSEIWRYFEKATPRNKSQNGGKKESYQRWESQAKKNSSRVETEENEVNLMSSRVVVPSKEWFEIHLDKHVVNKWTEMYKDKKHSSHMLKIECSSSNNNNNDNECADKKLKVCKKPKYRPFILLQLTEKNNKKKRRKRRSTAINCVPGYEKCCLRKLYVSFKDIHWDDWVIEPAGYEVNYCEGNCAGITPQSHHGSHAFVKQKLTSSHSHLNICCVPVKFSSLTLLHYNDRGTIHQTVLKNMTVDECRCV